MELIRRLLRRMTAVSAWPLWSLPRWLLVYVLAIIAVDLAAIGLAASITTITMHTSSCSASCWAARRSPSS